MTMYLSVPPDYIVWLVNYSPGEGLSGEDYHFEPMPGRTAIPRCTFTTKLNSATPTAKFASN
jgi:hypothetical protein